jgi:hypothetical protein
LGHGVDRLGGKASSPASSSTSSDALKAAIDRTLALRRDIDRFLRTWPTLNSGDDLLPAFTWTELERQLSSLSAGPHGAFVASGMIRSVRQLADAKPPEMVLREILCMACALMDDGAAIAPPNDDA